MDGRKKIRLIPAGMMGIDPEDEAIIFQEVFGMTEDQVKEHRDLQKLGRVFITENARCGCQYQVVIRQGRDVPHNFAFGDEIVMILVRRTDGKPEPYHWRDLQDIKDVVIGNNREALELYPANKRRLRDIGFRVLWGVLSNEWIKLGWPDTNDN